LGAEGFRTRSDDTPDIIVPHDATVARQVGRRAHPEVEHEGVVLAGDVVRAAPLLNVAQLRDERRRQLEDTRRNDATPL
jgi:hypothetical protein